MFGHALLRRTNRKRATASDCGRREVQLLSKFGLLAFATVGLAACGNTDPSARVQQYRQAKAQELVGTYNQAKRRGDVLAMCVNSNQVAAAYRDAHDAGNADVWATVGAGDCRRARNLLATDLGKPEKPEG